MEILYILKKQSLIYKLQLQSPFQKKRKKRTYTQAVTQRIVRQETTMEKIWTFKIFEECQRNNGKYFWVSVCRKDVSQRNESEIDEFDLSSDEECTAWKVSKYRDFSGPYSARKQKNTDQKKLGIWTLFTQWWPAKAAEIDDRAVFLVGRTSRFAIAIKLSNKLLS